MVGTSTFCSVRSVVVRFNGRLVVVVSSSVIAMNEVVGEAAVVLVGSVIGFLFDVAVGDGRRVVLCATTVDLTVEVLIVGLGVVTVGFILAVVGLVFSSDSTENVVTSMSSADNVVGSTFTMKSVGVGRGRGIFVVST